MYPANGSGRPHGRSASERVSKLLEAGDFPTAPPTPPEGGARAGSGMSMHQLIASGSELGDLGDPGAEVHPVMPSDLYVTSLSLYMHPTCSHARPACILIACGRCTQSSCARRSSCYFLTALRSDSAPPVGASPSTTPIASSDQ